MTTITFGDALGGAFARAFRSAFGFAPASPRHLPSAAQLVRVTG
ncbi:hypothetical protein ACWD0J_22830 [Streptomyces sp. NPDC003011]